MATGQATLNPALMDFWSRPARNRILYGGRSSSKTWDAAGFAVFLSQRCRIRFLCCRQFQNKIEESVYTVLKVQIERFGLSDRFKILDNKIVCLPTGSEFIFYGLWRSMGQIRGLEGIDICWLEEAHLLEESQWQELEPTLRKQGSQFWIIFNPHLATDFTWKRFVMNPPPDTIIRKINYGENPFLSETMLAVIAALKAEDEDGYNHIYLGEPQDNDDASVVKRSHCMAAIDAHVKLGIEIRGEHRMGFDVADSGADLCALVYAHGPLAVWSDMWKGKEDELPKSTRRTWHEANLRGANIVYDAIGVGASTGGIVNDLNAANGTGVRHVGFFAGGGVEHPEHVYPGAKVKNRDFFSNIKAQAWWDVADRLRNTYQAVRDGRKSMDDGMIFISSDMPNLDRLIDELCTPRRDFDRAGRVKVEDKADLAKRGIASPNLADAFIMAVGNRRRTLSDAYGNHQ